MEMITVLQAMGLALNAPPHSASANDLAADPSLAPARVKDDDLDLSTLRGMQILQDRIEQAIAAAGIDNCPEQAAA